MDTQSRILKSQLIPIQLLNNKPSNMFKIAYLFLFIIIFSSCLHYDLSKKLL